MNESRVFFGRICQTIDSTTQSGNPQTPLLVFLNVVHIIMAQRIKVFGIVPEVGNTEASVCRFFQPEQPVGLTSHPNAARMALCDAIDKD